MSDAYDPPGWDRQPPPDAGGPGPAPGPAWPPSNPQQGYSQQGYPPPASPLPAQPSYGAPVPPYGQPAYGQPEYGQPAYGQPPYGSPVQSQNGKGRTAMILGIIALFVWWIPFIYLITALPMAIIAIVLGTKGRGLSARGLATNPGQALAGVICGWIAIGLCVVNFIVGVLLVV